MWLCVNLKHDAHPTLTPALNAVKLSDSHCFGLVTLHYLPYYVRNRLPICSPGLRRVTRAEFFPSFSCAENKALPELAILPLTYVYYYDTIPQAII
jgi:hypothetical protein